MANCTVSGTFTNPQGTAIEGAVVRFNIQSPVTSSTNLLVPKEITTTTASDGTWSLSIVQGIAGTLTLDVAPNTTSPVSKYKFSLIIPSTSSATFASCWVESPNFAGQSTTTPFTFADVGGTLATAQLPALASANFWLGNGSSAATAVTASGDVSMANTGAVTVNTVGGSTAANINTATGLANAATSSNTVSTIVKRGSSGEIAVGAVAATSVAASAGITAGTTIAATGNVTGANLSGTNTGDLTLGSFGATPAPQGASLSGQTLQMQPADGTNPGGVSTSAQTFAGAKTFTGGVVGNVTGNVIGDVTGALTGNVTGNLTGNVTGNVSGTAATITGVSTVEHGGTGLATLTANNVLLGNGASNVQFVAPGSTGNVLTSDGSTWTSAAPGSSPVVSAEANVGAYFRFS